MTRVLLFVGKGGVGKTTVAAATALRAAEAGRRVLVCSTDPAHSLADAFDRPLGDAPTGLASFGTGGVVLGQQLDARVRFEAAWNDVREYVGALLDWAGADAMEAEELAVIPGLDEVFALAELREHVTSGAHDLVVVDCAPTAETLRLLSLPDVLGWYMERVFPAQRAATRIVRPLLARVISMPIASDRVFVAVQRFARQLDDVRRLLGDPERASARLVVNAERMVIAEARRTFTYLSLFGYHVDAVVANRLLPEEAAGGFFEEWHRVQAGHLATIRESFAPLPVLEAPLASAEPIGIDRLTELAAVLYRAHDPCGHLAALEPMRIARDGEQLVLSLHLPFAAKDDVEVAARGGELFVAVGPHRRVLVLPDSLRCREVSGARLDGDRLEVAFAVSRRATVGA